MGTIIAFEKDEHPLIGIYRPLYRSGNSVYSDPKNMHDKEWFKERVAKGGAAILELPEPQKDRAIVLCLSNQEAPAFDFLTFQRVRGTQAWATIVSLREARDILWKATLKTPASNLKLRKELFAMMLARTYLDPISERDFPALTTTIAKVVFPQNLGALMETWGFAQIFLKRFGHTLPMQPKLLHA